MLEAALALIAGLVIGSFLNVCIYRIPRDLSVVRPRSFCPACDHPIAWYDNVPLWSYLALRGRCRHCAKPIPVRYPIVEGLTGAAFFLLLLKYGPTLVAAKYCLFSALVIGLIFSDLETLILPNEFTLLGLAAGLLLAALVPVRDFYLDWFLAGRLPDQAVSIVESLLGAALPSLLLWGLAGLFLLIRHKEGLGLGDVKMVAMVGAFTGLAGAGLTVMIGSLLGTVIGLIYVYATGKNVRTYELPFGAFLGAAALAVPFLLPALR
ncbi:MAG: prepilin peptidase [Bryobacteraceae bacterium]